MRVNIDDVAREAGVHRSTVSRALTGSGPVSLENREKVRAAVKKLNYHPNTLAGALKSRRRNTWGLLSFWYFAPSSTDHYYSNILGGLSDAAGKVGYRLLLQNLVGRFDQNEECVRFCHDSQLCGVAVIAPRCQESTLEELKRLAFPAVLVAYRPRDPELSFIDLDNVEAGRLVVQHLAQKGHEKIAFIGGELKLSANARDRYKGYLDGMKEADLSVDRDLVHNRDFTPGFGVEAFLALLALPRERRPTAVFCANDNMAVAVMDVAREKGLNIPGDLAVAGIDDNPMSATSSPPLTTVYFPFYEMGVQAGEMLRKLADDPRVGPLRTLLEPRLVARASTGGETP